MVLCTVKVNIIGMNIKIILFSLILLGDDIRKVLISNEYITYDEWILMIRRMFNGNIIPNYDLTIKYYDKGRLSPILDSIFKFITLFLNI